MSLIKQIFPSSRKFTPASTEVNWQYVNTLVHGPGANSQTDAEQNSALFACLITYATDYTEAPLVVVREDGKGNDRRIEDAPLANLLEYPTPNGELTMSDLRWWTAWALKTDGNAYWLKVRSGDAETGNVIQLWPISPTLIQPVTRKNSGDWISYYEYQIQPGVVTDVPVRNIIHFKHGVDDRDMRKGVSSLKVLLRQVSTDDEADKFIDALLKNYAVPGLVVMPTGGLTLTEPDADRITDRLRQKFGSANRGNIAVMSRESSIQQFGFSPKDLDMSILHRIPEERISAVIGVPAIVAGLGAGLERATYANGRELREMYTEQRLVPWWRMEADKLNTALRPDFTRERSIKIKTDLSGVRSLQEDEDAKYKRLYTATGKPFLMRNEARTDIGRDPVKGWDEEDVAPKPAPVVVDNLAAARQDNRPDNDPANRQEEPAKGDMDKWQAKALKALRAGKSAAVPFESAHIPAETHAQITARLAEAGTTEDVERAFQPQTADLAAELKRANDLLERLQHG